MTLDICADPNCPNKRKVEELEQRIRELEQKATRLPTVQETVQEAAHRGYYGKSESRKASHG